MEEQIDVLMATYNTSINYLRLQINSILNQTYKNIKLIISDDCYTKKEVLEILKEYEKKDSRIKLYFQDKNLGYTKNFEFLLQKSSANYISFSDHDDIWYSNKLEESIKVLKEKDVDLIYCDAKQIDENGKVLHNSYLKYKNLPIINDMCNKEILAVSRHFAIGCSQLFTKKVKELLLPYTENTMAHDWNSVYIASRLKGVYCIDKPLFEYRIHSNNAFGGRNIKQNMEIWKERNGSNYNSYLKYRHKVITQTYLAGALMCKSYSDRLNNKSEMEDKIIKYYEQSQKAKIIYWPIYKYFKYLYFKGIGKRKYKEIMILHFPLISYFIFTLLI